MIGIVEIGAEVEKLTGEEGGKGSIERGGQKKKLKPRRRPFERTPPLRKSERAV